MSYHLLSDFDYVLPPEKIATHPLPDRPAAKMMVLNRASETTQHQTFRELPDFLKPGDVLVLNNTRVIPARILGHRLTGSKVEVLLLKKIESTVWECLLKPSGKIRKNQVFELGRDDCFISAKTLDDPRKDDGRRLIRFETEDFQGFLEKAGHVPLPPYIHRPDEKADITEYQTVYARQAGSVAAPTAGLHFDQTLLEALRKKGVEIVEITLEVGYGTFQLMQAENVRDHAMATETYEISIEAAEKINRAKKEKRRIVACGTTSVRTLESAVKSDGAIEAGRGPTGLFIYPPYEFKVVDALITNFHFPKTSLLVLVSAFLGYEKMMAAYKIALESNYRFASYGDGMLIL